MKAIWLMSVALVACASNEAVTTSTTVTSAEISVGADAASNRITAARCDRQVACGNVGVGRWWRDRGTCERDVDALSRYVLGRSCSSVDAPRLGACLDEVRDAPCEERTFPLSCEGVHLCR